MCAAGLNVSVDYMTVFTTEFVMSPVKQREHQQLLFKQCFTLAQEQFVCSLVLVNDDL